jgi:membrane associated rhomboid family serine protease
MNNYRPSFLSSIPPVVKNLIAINLILWLASIVAPGFLSRFGVTGDLNDILGMHYWQSSKFNIIQLVSYMFMHGGLTHILFNMFALYMFGGVLENYWGPKRFLIYYLITGIGAGIVQQLFWTIDFNHIVSVLNESISSNSGSVLLNNQDVLDKLSKYFGFENISRISAPEIIELKKAFLNMPVTVGASGAVFGLLLAFGWLFPEQRLFVFPIPVPIKARIFVLIYGVIELSLGVAQFSGDSIAHFAHLGGMLFGIILILYWKRKNLL